MTIEMVSKEYALVFNLIETAKFHKKNCSDGSCNSSLRMLRALAEYMIDNNIPISERDTLRHEVEEADCWS